MAIDTTSPIGHQHDAPSYRYRDLFTHGRAQLSLAIILLLLVATLDQLIVATAMPTLVAQLGDVQLYSWAFAAYTLASIAALPIFGALTGRWGLRSTLVVAMGLFITGAVLCALAASMSALLVGRAAQGFGAGGLFATPFIMISQRFPATLQPQALALTSGVWGISSLSGPLVGALLLELWGWPAIFWVNLPLGVLVLALGWLSLHDAAGGDRTASRVNVASPLLLTLAVGLLLGAPSAGPGMRWPLALAGLAVATAFVIAERRSAEPIVPASALFSGSSLGPALAVIVLATVTFFAAETFLPLLLQSGRSRSAVEVGMLISAGAVAWTAGSLWSGRQTYPRPLRNVVFGVLLLIVGSLLLLLVIALHLPIEAVFPAWVLTGFGMGVVFQTSNVVVLDNARGPRANSITAAGQLALNLGTVAGTALAGVAAQLGFGDGFTPGRAGDAIHGAQLALLERGVLYTLILAVGAGLTTLLIARRLPRERQRGDEQANGPVS
jgi:MFS family permease